MDSDICTEKTVPWYAVAGGMIAGLCSSTIVSNLIKSNIDMPVNLKNKIIIFVGSSAISAVVSAMAAKQVESDITEASQFITGWMKMFKNGGKDEGRSGECDSEESAAQFQSLS